jgi:hypothetical protein
MKRVALAFLLVVAAPARGGIQTPGCQPGPGPHRWYVDANAAGTATGFSWPDAFPQLQRAIQRAQLCEGDDEIWVAAGTYYPDRTAAAPSGTGDPLETFRLRTGVSIYGGFLGHAHPAGGETRLEERDPVKNLTILSGDIGDDSEFPVEPDTYNVVTAEYGAAGHLEGFTIEGAFNPQGIGGGLYVIIASPTVVDCTFRRNRAARGGGAYIWTYDFVITPTFINCRFLGNAALVAGGGGAAVEAAYFFNCDFSSVDAAFVNCLFSGNTAAGGAAGLAVTRLDTCASAAATLTNCTFTQNAAAPAPGIGAGAIGGSGECFEFGSALVRNSILWGNSHPQIAHDCLAWTITDSDVEGQAFPGNISLDPLFCDPAGADGAPGTADDNPRLGAGSPALDAGSDAIVSLEVADLGGQPRQFESLPGGALVDMGAYESQHRASCPWDLDGDGFVGLGDLAALLAAWGPCPGCAADFECDLAADVNDFLALLQRWGPCRGLSP